jgi:hypothetical protein
MPFLRGQLLTDGHFPVSRGGERVRLLARRVFLRERFAAVALPLNVTDAARRSPGWKAGKGCRPAKGDAKVLGEWGTLVLIAVVFLFYLFSGGG